ncbi:MAG: serpin family protein [Gemmatimonadales bacterium]|nr:serpin family protein [Gemmatimonadales bacterium]
MKSDRTKVGIVKHSALLWLAAAVGLATGCGDAVAPHITELPRELTVAESKLVSADNAFAFKLFREVSAQAPDDANVFISPLSVGMALGMAYNGAAGTTRDAMQSTLELQGMSLQEVNEAYQSLIALLQGLDPTVDFLLANSIWYRQEITVTAAFLENMERYFGAEVQSLDFSAPDAASIINGWVRDNTRGRISEIVTPPIDTLTVMFLINAVYFKGSWTYRFDRDRTHDAQFTRADGSHTTVPLMSHGEEVPVRVYWGSGFGVVDLPYGGGAYAMTIVLPENPAAAVELSRTLTQNEWDSWIAGMDSTSLWVSLPKWRLEDDLTLNDVLKTLGMSIAFVPGEADFSDMIPDYEAFISRVKHKTFIEVNEEGTEAAAVTSVEVGVTSAPPSFVADHPFVFAIRERLSGTILFIGKMADPGA